MRIKAALSLVLTALIALFAASSAQAALTVTNTNDSGAGSLRQAIAEAGPGETINLPAGTYTLTSEPLSIERSVTLAGGGAASTTIRAGAPFRVLQILGPADVTINGVTIRDGKTVEKNAVGGGIISLGSNLTLRNVVVTGNTADANGAPGEKGGQAEAGGLISVNGALNVINSTISENLATARGGSGAKGGTAGGAGLVVVGPLTIENSTISGNYADAGGGQGPANPEQDGGAAVGAGAYAIQSEATPSAVRGSAFTGNIADVSPGAGGTGGEAVGGGIFVTSTASSFAFQNTTIVGNAVRSLSGTGGVAGGGVIAIPVKASIISFSNTTISGNRAESAVPGPGGGGNVYTTGETGGTISFQSSIVANGVGPAGFENCRGLIPATSLGFNIDSLDQCGFKAAGDKVNTNPLLGPLQSNGGPTQTMAPALGSPAIDQGKSFGLTSDQRGIVRPIDLPSIANSAAAGADGSDIGAVEFQPSNAFTLGKLTRNKKKGTARLSVLLPSPSAGTLTLSGKGLKTQTAAITGETEVKLLVALSSKKLKKALRKKGKRKVGINVTYAPTGNSAATQSRKAKLIKKKRKHKKKHRKPGKR